MTYQRILLAVTAGVLSAVWIDLGAFVAARKADPKATFDWALAAARWVQGGIAGVLATLGYEVASV